MPIPLRRKLLFAATATILAVVFAFGALLVVDIWLHRRAAPWLGYNVWGYRGPSAGKKRPGEYRVVMLGGSVTYGYGVSPDQTIPVDLERALRTQTGSDKFKVINLAYNSEGAYSFKFTLRDYEYLDYDLAILFEGYNDMSIKQNTSVYRHESPIFRMTGYMPILPVVFREKAAAMLHGGDMSALYEESDKMVFRPTWRARAGAGALKATVAIENSIEKQFDSGTAIRIRAFLAVRATTSSAAASGACTASRSSKPSTSSAAGANKSSSARSRGPGN